MVSKITKRIYLDYGAATPVDSRVLDAMEPYWSISFGNPSSLHHEGVEARNALESARSTVAEAIHARPEQIVFTSGGTESNNLAVQGVVHRALKNGRKLDSLHVITSAIEHSSVRNCCVALEERGVQVSYVGVDTEGFIDLEELGKTITSQTVLVSVVLANNEVGTIQDIRRIVQIVRHVRANSENIYPLLHIDASQAPVWMGLHVEKLSVDLMTLGGQKIYAPKGIGCLYVNDATTLAPTILGGGHEHGLRSGTPPVPLIVGFATALRILEEERHTYVTEKRELRDWFIDRILGTIPSVVLNGPRDEKRIIGNVNISFEGVEAERLVIELDARGVAVGAGSACRTREHFGASHVIRAIRGESDISPDAIRMTLSRHTSREELERVYEILQETVSRIRSEN